mmetsp:Transcript_129192/g.361551  ORF Transcript_129192/g.361551 Transcript_129192/m.361551 type:complete len:239 (-) Transcript_129192:711-1427(-)
MSRSVTGKSWPASMSYSGISRMARWTRSACESLQGNCRTNDPKLTETLAALVGAFDTDSSTHSMNCSEYFIGSQSIKSGTCCIELSHGDPGEVPNIVNLGLPASKSTVKSGYLSTTSSPASLALPGCGVCGFAPPWKRISSSWRCLKLTHRFPTGQALQALISMGPGLPSPTLTCTCAFPGTHSTCRSTSTMASMPMVKENRSGPWQMFGAPFTWSRRLSKNLAIRCFSATSWPKSKM